MRTARALTLVVGVAASLLGLAVVAGAPLGFGLTDVFVGVAAALAAIQGLRYVQRRRETTPRTSETDDPEVRVAVPVPGDDLDADLATATSRWGSWRARDRAVNRLETAATRALVRRDGRSPEAAAAMLDAGTWTDDPVAARLLGADVSLSLARRLRLLVVGEATLTARVTRTVAAIERIGRTSDSTPGGATPGGRAAADADPTTDGEVPR